MNDDRKHGVELPDHEYDGIRELDHPTPRWWQRVFISTILFAIGYVVYYHGFGAPSIQDELKSDLDAIQKIQTKSMASAKLDPKVLAEKIKEPELVSQGLPIFQSRCVSCHAEKGRGLIGPNLTDLFWLHGDGTPIAIYETIATGVPEKGMPAWNGILKPEEIVQVVAYVTSLKGLKIDGAKPPQGSRFE